LTLMKELGLVLAPEIVEWDLHALAVGGEQLRLLQRRVSFTELSANELAPHSEIFGPIALAFDIAKLRENGAMPVIYVPQGVAESPFSQIATFCVRGAYHTKHVLRQLQELKELSDPDLAAKHFRMPTSQNYKLNLQNSDPAGSIVAKYDIPASYVQDVLSYVGFNNIPFNHSVGVLGVFMNMFYPTDNTHTGDQLGYYRQREWRLVAGDISVNDRPIGRELTEKELCEIENIDPEFWTRNLEYEGNSKKRSSLALIYDPVPDWRFFDFVETVYVPKDVPKEALEQARTIVGDKLVEVM